MGDEGRPPTIRAPGMEDEGNAADARRRDDRLDLVVTEMGTNTPHDLDYTLDRPQGTPFHLVLHFHSPMEIHTRQGLVPANPGDCIIYAPYFRQFYRGRNVEFRDDWLYLEGRDVARLVKRYRLPANQVFRPRNTRFVATILDEIKRERVMRQPFWNEAVARRVEELFMQFARNLVPMPEVLAPTEFKYLDALNEVRMQVHDRIDHAWTVAEMAKLAHMSANRFAVLYRKIYEVSPIEDLIQVRINRAQWLLRNRQAEIAAVAEECGFRNLFHFNRIFHRRVGTPPGRFRRGGGR